MSRPPEEIEALTSREYEHGWETEIESDTAPPGLDESTVALISEKKGEPDWLREWRPRAFPA